MQKEIRNIDHSDSEVRVIGESRLIEGYAIIFNKESRDLGGFKEVILPEAIDGVIEQSDVLALLNHSVDRGVLARSTNGKGTLKLEADNKGVRYSFEAPDTALGNELVSGLRRGDIRTSSFGFSMSSTGQSWEKREDGYLRTIKRFDALYDVSPVYREAYADTSVALRNLDEFKGTDLNPSEESKPVVANTAPEPIEDTKEREMSPKELRLRRINQSYKF